MAEGLSMRYGVFLLLLASCGADQRPIDLPDIDLRPPSAQDLETRVRAFREGREKHHGDPRQVAHVALLDYVDVPWRGGPFRREDYEFFERSREHPDWGAYVVRGFVERTGSRRTRRYRVKVRPYEEIWYPIQVSRYIIVDLPEEDPNEGPPNVRKQ
ncbi:MAG: hypothetical protein HYY17_07165 [Planctomycetes bacterium]|nr:hypothetical protein [Planctomycetota bacterium]